MQVTIDGLEAYLQKLYGGKVTEQGLFMKLVEEMGEVAEALNKRTGRKASDGSDLQAELGEELADVIHYAVAIAAVNGLDLNEIILKKQENSRANITQKARSLESEMKDFQRKIENNAFLTRERAEQEQQRLLKKQEELQNLDNQLAQELMQEQQKLNEQLRDTIVSQLRAFNQDKGFQVVFSNTVGDNILLAGDSYDITAELLEFLNKNYSAPAQ